MHTSQKKRLYREKDRQTENAGISATLAQAHARYHAHGKKAQTKIRQPAHIRAEVAANRPLPAPRTAAATHMQQHIKPTGSHQRRIQQLGPIRGADDEHTAVRGIDAVHLVQQRGEDATLERCERAEPKPNRGEVDGRKEQKKITNEKKRWMKEDRRQCVSPCME